MADAMKPGWLADDDDGGRGPMGEEGDDGERSHERRIEARYPAHAFPHIVAVRVRPGIQARLVDLSASGAQLETARRLWHGSFVHVQLLTDRGVTTVRARVVRNHVGTLSACLIRYRSAVRFDRRLTWPRREGHEPGGEVGPVAPAGAEGLRQAMR